MVKNQLVAEEGVEPSFQILHICVNKKIDVVSTKRILVFRLTTPPKVGGVGLEPTVSNFVDLRVYLNLNDNIVSDISHSKNY